MLGVCLDRLVLVVTKDVLTLIQAGWDSVLGRMIIRSLRRRGITVLAVAL